MKWNGYGMGFLIGALFLACLYFANEAIAQEPLADVDLKRVGAKFVITCVAPPDTDLFELCFARTDLEDGIIELGCTATSANAETKVEVSVQKTVFVDARVRCYAVDLTGNVGDMSENAGIIDFTPPGRGRILDR